MWTCDWSQKVDTLARMFPILHCLKISTCRPVDLSHITEDRHFDQNVFCTSLPQQSTCRPVTHPRRLTLWSECFLHVTVSKCRHVDMSHVPECQHFDQNVSCTSLHQQVNLSTCHISQNVDTLTRMASKCRHVELSHIPKGRHFNHNVFCASLPQNVNLSTCHKSKKVHTFTRLWPTLYLHWTLAYEYINCIHTPQIFHFY